MRLTANHVRDFAGISRTDLHRWLIALPPFSAQPTQARKAREFDARDLIFFAVVKLLTVKAGLKIDAVARFSAELRLHLNKMSDLSTMSRQVELLFSIDKGWSIAQISSDDHDLILRLDLHPIWSRMHQFLGLTTDWAQANLPLGLQIVDDLKKQRARA